jgi:hypothetical protein
MLANSFKQQPNSCSSQKLILSQIQGLSTQSTNSYNTQLEYEALRSQRLW